MDAAPETALPLLLGVAGSAFCASVARTWQEVRGKLPPDVARSITTYLGEVRPRYFSVRTRSILGC